MKGMAGTNIPSSNKVKMITLQVQMAGLPDGTNCTRQTILSASARELTVTTTNSDYQSFGDSESRDGLNQFESLSLRHPVE
jgi:hypothetical protein